MHIILKKIIYKKTAFLTEKSVSHITEEAIDELITRGYYSYNYRGIRYKKRCEEEIIGMSTLVKIVNYYLNGSAILGEDWIIVVM